MSPPLRVIHIVCEARAFERVESVARRSVASIYGTMQDGKWEEERKIFLPLFDVFLFRFNREFRRRIMRVSFLVGAYNMGFLNNFEPMSLWNILCIFDQNNFHTSLFTSLIDYFINLSLWEFLGKEFFPL